MRLALRIDALVEAVLAACCVALAVGQPRAGGWRLPGYLSAGWVLTVSVRPGRPNAAASGFLSPGVRWRWPSSRSAKCWLRAGGDDQRLPRLPHLPKLLENPHRPRATPAAECSDR